MSSSARRCWITITFLLSGLAATSMVHAAEIHGRSSTQLLWYNDIVDGSSQLDLAEYLLIRASDIDKEGKITLKGYGRLLVDLKDVPAGEDRVKERLYYLYADYKDFMDEADIRLGRQFVNLSAGSALIDGVQAEFNKLGSVGITVMGGRDIKFGEEGTLTSHASAVGVAAYLTGLKKTDLDISYFRAYDYSDVARDILGVNFKHLARSLRIYSNARYDLIAEGFNEILGGVNYFPTLDLMLTAEYYESTPTFDSTSIFSVFSANKYQEEVFKAQYTALPWLDISAGYMHEDFDDDATADVYEIGLKFRPSVNMTIGLFHDGRSGYGGDLDGIKLYAEYRKFRKWNAAAGIDYDSYERDDMTGAETAKRYWVAGSYKFNRTMSGSIRLEDNVNINYSKDMQGRVTFAYDF